MISNITFLCGIAGFGWLAWQWIYVVGRWWTLATNGELSGFYKVPPFCFFADRILGSKLVMASVDTLITFLIMRAIVKMIPSAQAAYIGAVLGFFASIAFRYAISGRSIGPHTRTFS